jgi:catechol 2,3-dioxygenase
MTSPQRQRLWGAPAQKSWFDVGSLFGGIEAADAILKAQPIIAT